MLIDTSALTAPPEDFAALSIEPEGLSPLGHRVFFISSLKYHGEEEAGAFARYVKCGEPQPVSWCRTVTSASTARWLTYRRIRFA